MHMQLPKVLPEFFLLLRPNVLEILASEDYHPTFCDEESEFVLLRIGELGELQAFDFCPDSGSQLRDGDGWVIGVEEVGLCLVSQGSFVDKVKGLCRWEDSRVVVDGEVVCIFVAFVSLLIECPFHLN